MQIRNIIFLLNHLNFYFFVGNIVDNFIDDYDDTFVDNFVDNIVVVQCNGNKEDDTFVVYAVLVDAHNIV